MTHRYVHVSAYLDVSVTQSQSGSLELFSSVFQDLHHGQEVAAVLGPLIGGES